MSYLSWVSDERLEECVRDVLVKADEALNFSAKKFERNVIDPFSIAFEMAGFSIESIEYWEKMEQARQAQKTLSNNFGLFHQKILGSVDGWTDMETGEIIDLVSEERKIIAEIKNKFNTLKGSDRSSLYETLKGLVMPKASKYKDYTSYYVEIIPKKTRKSAPVYDHFFTPSDKNTSSLCPANELIRQIDGKSFYKIVTGDANALPDLYKVLPQVIAEVGGYSFSKIDLSKMNRYFTKAYG